MLGHYSSTNELAGETVNMTRLFLAFTFIFFAASGYAASDSYMRQPQNHQLRVTLDPEEHSLHAEDHITVPRGTPRTLTFLLHRDLNPVSVNADIKFIGKAENPWLSQYSVTLRKGSDNFTVTYGGEIFHPLQQEIQEARSFENTPGIIAEDGVVLGGGSGWYPDLQTGQGDEMLTFTLEVQQPRNWRAISQGARSMVKNGSVVWQERQPQREIHLVAGHLKEYDLSKSGVQAMVYLRNDDVVLAQRYLEAAVRYINMYQQLIAPYPYAKFALVENFWETGFGMPSFTLLGSQVIRLPFIIDSSYPHEILHNWWGNGVYVDYDKGNWSEGLTAYLGDHMLQEQKGAGAEYRRSTLQKYADFVSSARDFPLTRFTSRNSASSEAVGYGKTMMMFHMLRRQIDDDRFIVALQNFYKTYQFRRASFSDLEQSFSEAAGKDFKPFFAQWTQQTGAPQLRLVSAQTEDNGEGYELTVIIEQTQSGPTYLLEVPVAVTMADEKDVYSTVVSMKDKQTEVHIQLNAKPLRVDIDPEFDLFRRLDSEEMPAAFSQVMGAEKLLIVLPSNALEVMRAQYDNIAQAWQQQPSRTTIIKWDDEVDNLPTEGAVWLFGWENKFRDAFQNALNSSVIKWTDSGAELEGKKLSRETDVLALAGQIEKTPAAWLAAPKPEMLPALAEKLPHYAKYSYAAFNGATVEDYSTVRASQPRRAWLEFPRPRERSEDANDAVTGKRSLAGINNIAKGTWPVMKSPMVMAVRQMDGRIRNVTRGNLAKRSSLVR